MDMKTTKDSQYLTLKEIQERHETFGILDDFDRDDCRIGDSFDSPNEQLTDAFQELGRINKRRKELIDMIMHA